MAQTLESWFKNMPPITKTYFMAVIITTIVVQFGLISYTHLYLDLSRVWSKFELWRLVTCFFFFGKFSLPWIFQMFILTTYTNLLESGYFVGNRGTADMSYMMGFGAIIIIIASYFIEGLFFPGPALVFMILYVWSRKDPYRQVVFWGFAFQAWHFPFVLMVFGFLLGNSPVLDIIGVVVGHIYHFLADIVPGQYGYHLMKTPEFVYNLFEHQNVHGQSRQWMRGQGQRLGQ